MRVSISASCFNKFRVLIHSLTGISIAEDRTSMVEGRLKRRLNALEMNSYDEYLKFVQRDRTEQQVFINLITTNETYCFRTPRIWDYLQETFLPEWFRRNPRETFKVWSAASSSGEEAHSVGVLCEAFRADNPGFDYQVLGTDLSSKMIDKCRTGNYSGRAVRMFRDTKPDWFAQYMQAKGEEEFQASPEIRSRLNFHEHNLFESLKERRRFDLVLLRNVLIYFTASDQEKVLSLISPRLREDGLLIIGESESLAHVDSGFTKKSMYVYEVEASSAALSKV